MDDDSSRITLHGLEGATKTDIEHVLSGLGLLRWVSRRGRPTLEKTQSAYLVEVGRQIEELKRSEPTITWRRIVGRLALKGIHISQRTARRRWERFKATL